MTAADRDPVEVLRAWQREARAGPGARRWLWKAARWISGIELPEEDAAALATAAQEGHPSVRMVLVRSVSNQGLVFHTNYRSRKGEELEANPRAALLFYWAMPPRQVRVEGAVFRLSGTESDAYWRSRPRGSQLAAVASRQSAPMADRAELLASLERARREHQGHEVPRPPWWGGYRVVPESIELWEGRTDRLHQRIRYRRSGPGAPWECEALQP